MSEALTDTIKAAGTMFITGRTGNALFLRRSALGDHSGEWCFPGGKVEPGESAQEAAERETREEAGEVKAGKLVEWTRQLSEGVDFTTFVSHASEEFTPTIDAEHTAWCWAPVTEPPEPLHPGARVALARLSMDELGVAQAIAAGQLVSPQRYGNFWLYAIRITGTGMAYRSEVKGADGKVERKAEFCWRDPSLYMNERFLQRCAGLPVLWDHTDGPKLDSDEYRERNVGSVFVPYFKGNDEVWAVAKIYDDACLAWLMDGDKSTSPGVVFTGIDPSQMLARDDGTNLLIESVPQLFDHIALCEAGVWDKGGAPTGVDNFNLTDEGLNGMLTKEEQAAADQARKDSDAKLDAIISGLGGINSRLDSLEAGEKARKDSEEKQNRFDSARKDRFGPRKDGESRKDYKARHDADETAMADALRKDSDEDTAKKDAAACRMDAEAAERKDGGESFEKWAKEENDEPAHRDDKSKKDADPGEEEEEAAKKRAKEEGEAKDRKDAEDQARKDSAVTSEEMRKQIEALTAQVKGMTTETPAAERDALARTQSRADSVAAMFGERATPPFSGESPLAYRKRQVSRFQKHSPRFKDSRLDSLDAAMLDPIEDTIYHDAIAAAKRPATSAPGVLIPITERIGGRDITRFNGDPMAWMGTFMTQGSVGSFIRNPNKN